MKIVAFSLLLSVLCGCSKEPEPFKVHVYPVYESDIIREANETGHCWANMICTGTRENPNTECKYCRMAFCNSRKSNEPVAK